jgi:hypothetical protein
MSVVVMMTVVLHGVLARFLRNILFRMLRVSRFRGLSYGLLAVVLVVIGMVLPVVVGLPCIMPVVAHVSASCWGESVSTRPFWAASLPQDFRRALRIRDEPLPLLP